MKKHGMTIARIVFLLVITVLIISLIVTSRPKGPFYGPKVNGVLFSDVCPEGGFAIFSQPEIGDTAQVCSKEITSTEYADFHISYTWDLADTKDADWDTFESVIVYPVSPQGSNVTLTSSCIDVCSYSIYNSQGALISYFTAKTDIWVTRRVKLDDNAFWIVIEIEGTSGHGQLILDLNMYNIQQLEIEAN